MVTHGPQKLKGKRVFWARVGYFRASDMGQDALPSQDPLHEAQASWGPEAWWQVH